MNKSSISISAFILFCLTISAITTASGATRHGKTNSALRFQRHLRAPASSSLRPQKVMLAAADGSASAGKAVVTIKFDHVLGEAEIADLVSRGMEFYYIDGEIARTGSIYPAKVPWEMVEKAGEMREVLRMEACWRPAVFPTLDIAAGEVLADSAWSRKDPLGLPVSGHGMRIADFDTGIDVFHPMFFKADGDTFDWIDYDHNGVFGSGQDMVDLNRNGTMDFGELLRFYDGRNEDWAGVFGTNTDGIYQPDWDWLYNDNNYNGIRDYGPGSGYNESSPGFGESIFIALDEDGDGSLDVGERLVMLGSSKIYATMNADSIERVRGTDLILSDEDTNGHGTAVSGVLAGGWPGRHRFTGIAPDAELLAGYFFSGVPISYLIPWARARGADAMLYEFGGFIWEFLDGSSLDEELVSIENETILQITPSGNLGRGYKHAITTVPAGGTVTLRITVPYYGGEILYFYGSTLWRTDLSDLEFRIRSPLGSEILIDYSTWFVDDYYVWQDFDTSPRGTSKFDFYIDRNTNPNAQGTWELKVTNTSLSPVEIISNVADHLSSWAGGAEFLDYATDQRNVTFPATADSSFTNGSYSTRGFEGYGGVGGGTVPAGEIAAFSGRGVRIDGRHLLSICSPGNYDVYSTRTSQDGSTAYPPGSYRQFSGTSAAGPFVAAAAALVKQVYPMATAAEIATLLSVNALEDGFTGTVYNDTWGYGKLRILGAIGVTTGVEDMADGLLPPALTLGRNYPNPFNPTTWIPFFIPSDGMASLSIYNVKGELVVRLRDTFYGRGPHSVRWNGLNGDGRPVGSGVYFCVLRQGGESVSRKLVLMR